MGSVQGHASSKSTSPHCSGIILGKECLEGLAGQGPVPHDVTVVQSKYGPGTSHSSATRSNKKCHSEYVCVYVCLCQELVSQMISKL